MWPWGAEKLVMPNKTTCCIMSGDLKIKSMHWDPRVYVGGYSSGLLINGTKLVVLKKVGNSDNLLNRPLFASIKTMVFALC
jgi:hypothetical protein